ncbi:MAG: tRNA lysidine(34) synthetase TilS [Pyrinomonadaceae bacterium]
MKTQATKRRRQSLVRITDFASRLFTTWQRLKLPTSNEHVILAVSGGADSTALFLALDELLKTKKLRLQLTVAHLDHALRKASKEDALWVAGLARERGYESVSRRLNVKKRAIRSGDNLEQAARRSRYQFLEKTAENAGSLLVLTAHTLDDQAETIMLRLLRGSAAEGLSGIGEVRSLGPVSEIQLARPLLSWARHADAESYCRLRMVDFRVDEMNENENFARVKVRKQLLPLMQSFNNKIVETLARTATLLREDAAALSNEANRLLELATTQQSGRIGETNVAPLNVDVLASAPSAVRRRALRLWILQGRGDLRRLEMIHLVSVEGLIEGNRGGRIAELPDGARVVRKRGLLELDRRLEKKRG